MSDYYEILLMSSMEKGDPFVLPDPTLGVDICIHCGGIIRHEDKGKHKKSHKHNSRREYLYMKAKECSIKKYH